MRTMFWCSILSAALATTACNKKADSTDKAGTEVKKAQEDVVEQRKDLDKATADRDSKPKDLNKAEGELAAAKVDLAAARDKYSITVNERLAKLDIKIKELEARGDAKAKDAAVTLRARRATLGTKLESMKDRAAGDWDAFTKDVDSTFDGIEKDVNDAVK